MSSSAYGGTPHNSYSTVGETRPAIQTSQPVKTLSSQDLFSGAKEIAISHAGALYRLKITRQGKLILNK